KDDNGWTYVSQRGRKTPTAGKPSTTSFFFTNIPAGATVSSLWKAFAKHDRVSDIYLAKKKTNNVELVSIDTFSNLHIICEEVGIPATKIKYLGGLHALLELHPKFDISTILSNTSHLDCFKNIQPWTKNFQLLNRLAWISIEGLPSQAWHEAAFTRIAQAWGEIIFPEKFFVDDILTCVRIRELIGKCYELSPTTSTASDEEVSTNYGDNFIADQEAVLGHENATKKMVTRRMMMSHMTMTHAKICSLTRMAVKNNLVAVSVKRGSQMSASMESLNVSREVEETLKVGNSIGFDMEDASIHVIGPLLISSFWGTDDFDFAFNPSNGKSGGILNVWDRNLFLKKEVVLRDGFTAIIGNWRDVLGDFVMVNVYAPQNSHAKSKLWSELLHLKNAKLGFWVCFGDFNIVKEESDRKGTQFDPNTTYSFNKFIDEAEL
ncbi:RNA-directed DNA polymerase, eukaryota, partial [Tanacetum coccineum]